MTDKYRRIGKIVCPTERLPGWLAGVSAINGIQVKPYVAVGCRALKSVVYRLASSFALADEEVSL